MARSMTFLGYAVALAFTFFVQSPVHAQGNKEPEFISGTVASIEKDKSGKNYKMKITRTDNGEELDVTVSVRTVVHVNAKGDEGFLRPGMFVETKATVSQQNLFAEEFTVYVGQFSPDPHMEPSKDMKDVVEIGGRIVETQNDGLMIQAGAQPQKISYDKQKLINVKISDASLIKEGDEVEVEGPILKAKKTLSATSLQVTQKEPIKSEYLATLEEKGKKPKATSKGKASKTKPEVDDVGVPKGGDPFKVTGTPKKKAAATKAEDKKADTKKDDAKADDAKKDDTKKDDVKKDDAKKAE
jgi:hypothetical protein